MPLSFTKGLCAVLDDGSMPPYHLSCPKGTWQSQQCVITTWNCALILEIYSPHKILRFCQPTKLNCIKMWYRGTESLRIFFQGQESPHRGQLWQVMQSRIRYLAEPVAFSNGGWGTPLASKTGCLAGEEWEVVLLFRRNVNELKNTLRGSTNQCLLWWLVWIKRWKILGWNIQLSWFLLDAIFAHILGSWTLRSLRS